MNDKDIPTEVLDVSESDGEGAKLPSCLSFSLSYMNLGFFGILDLVDEW